MNTILAFAPPPPYQASLPPSPPPPYEASLPSSPPPLYQASSPLSAMSANAALPSASDYPAASASSSNKRPFGPTPSKSLRESQENATVGLSDVDQVVNMCREDWERCKQDWEDQQANVKRRRQMWMAQTASDVDGTSDNAASAADRLCNSASRADAKVSSVCSGTVG